MGDGGDCEMRGVGMHGRAGGTAEPGEPGGAAQEAGGMRERGDARDTRDAREVPLEARVEECPATDELRASFRSAINRILAQSHGIYDVALRSSPSQSHAEAQRGEEMGALLHQIIDKWVQYSQEEFEEILEEQQINAAFSRADRLQQKLQLNRLPTTLQREAAGVPGVGGTVREVAAVRVESSRQQVQAVKQAIQLVEQELQSLGGTTHDSQPGGAANANQ
ncbi:unnamed protein product [Closterium sp. Naga37s-1]|nr:unnamed protein product [Closterium sp. Naga37s-1]